MPVQLHRAPLDFVNSSGVNICESGSISNPLPVQIVSDSAQTLYRRTLQWLVHGEIVESVKNCHSVGSGWGLKERQTKEIRYVTLILTNPRDRLINSPMFLLEKAIPRTVLGTLSDELSVNVFAFYDPKVVAFSDDGLTLPTNYGRRIRSFDQTDQIAQVIRQFKQDPNTRRAVIHIHAVQDTERRYDPCIDSLHFLIRNGTLECHTMWRSENGLTLLPTNLFEFTMLHELIASELGIDLGRYVHTITSLHYYLDDQEKLEFVLEDLKTRESPPVMDRMTDHSLEQVSILRDCEKKLRTERLSCAGEVFENLSEYWRKIGQIIAYSIAKNTHNHQLVEESFLSSPWKNLLQVRG
ncbi:MAG: thymidylate synthase [Chlamydiales bacterium]